MRSQVHVLKLSILILISMVSTHGRAELWAQHGLLKREAFLVDHLHLLITLHNTGAKHTFKRTTDCTETHFRRRFGAYIRLAQAPSGSTENICGKASSQVRSH